METINPSENEDVKSVTQLTDDEIKDFNTDAERSCFLPIRNALKDVLDVILLTAKHFYRLLPSNTGYPDLPTDDLVDAIATAIYPAMQKVDEMDVTELAKIAEHTNYVYDAFKLIEEYMPNDAFSRVIMQPTVEGTNFPHEGFLRKVLDLVCILCIPATQYKGSDIGYGTAILLKNKLAEYPGGKNVIGCLPGDYGYMVYYYKQVACSYNSIYPTVISTLRLWADTNLDDNSKDKFLLFLMKHESDIFKYMQLKQRQNLVANFDYEGMCTFFYRWFLNEQASK